MSNNMYINQIKEGIIDIIKNAIDDSTNLVDSKKQNLDVFSITEENIAEINNINKTLKSLSNIIDILKNPRIEASELCLDSDFTKKKIKYIKIEDNLFYVDTQKDCLVKLCEYLTEDESGKQQFLNVVNKFDKLFSDDKTKLISPKLISTINMYVETQRNSNSLARIMKRILIEFGLSEDIIRIGIK